MASRTPSRPSPAAPSGWIAAALVAGILAGCTPVPGGGEPSSASTSQGPSATAPVIAPAGEKETVAPAAALAAASAVPAPSGTAAEGKTATPGEAPKPEASAPQLSAECQKKLDELLALATEIPAVFRDLKKPVAEVDKDVARAEELSRAFLKDCGDNSTAACEAKAVLARMLVARQKRYKEELEGQKLPPEEVQARVKARAGEVAELTRSAIADCPEGSRPWCTSQRLVMDASLADEKYDEVYRIGELLLEKCPDYEMRTLVVSTLSQAYMQQRRYLDLVRRLDRIVQSHADDLEYVVYNIRLFDALYGAAQIEEVEELLHLIRTEYPQRIQDAPEGSLKGQYEQWYHCQSLFWLGFFRMASGDMAAADKYFAQNIDEIDSLEAKLASEGKGIDNVCPIIRDFRSRHLRLFIEEHYGKPPAHDIDDLLWATPEKRFSLKDAIGSTVVVVMRQPGNLRSQTFIQEMDRLVKERSDQGLRGVWVYFLSGRADPADEQASVARMQKEISDLGLSLPAGYDPDRQGQRAMRGLFGTIGTASCTVINRRGEVEWWLADTRDLDRSLAVRVVERILSEK